MSQIRISPSLLAADFACLDRELARVEKAGADCIHLDVMDGIFVPNLSFGIPVVQSIRKVTALPFDLHLMIMDPLRYIEAFSKAGAQMITFHLESHSDPLKTIQAIHQAGKKAGLSICPKTPAEALLPYLDQLDLVLVMSVEPGFGGQSFMDCALDKIRFLRKAAPELTINVDGGINEKTGTLCRQAGADMLVAGSYVFGAENAAAAIASLRNDSAKDVSSRAF
ncbi:MAG: ribulose-phosphate 3-epimerase [Candidatus Merdivicinus sp.]